METILKREKFVPKEEMTLANAELLARAREKLQYDPSALDTQKVLAQRRVHEQKVASVLESLGIEPLANESVKKYQKEMARKVESKGSNRFVKFMHSRRGEPVVVIVGIAVFVPAIVLVIATGINGDPDKHILYHAVLLKHLWEVAISLICGWVFCMVARHKATEMFSAAWEASYLSQYRAPVPDFALERAMQIKEVLPTAQFVVDYLKETRHGVNTEYKPVPPDPFMVMRYEHVVVYLDVWDEPKFEGRRTK